MKRRTRRDVVLALAVAVLLSACSPTAVRKENADAHYRMAKSYLQQGRGFQDEVSRRKAYPELARAIELAPKNAEYHLLFGTLLFYEDQIIEAEKEIKSALQYNPDLGEAHNNLGLVYLKQDRLNEAIEEFKKAIANLSYQTPEIGYFNLGRATYRAGDYLQAIEAFKKTLTIIPNLEEAHYLLGRSYSRLGLLEEARIAYTDTLDLNPQSIRTHFELGVTLFKLDRKEVAADHFQKVVELDPGSELAEKAKSFSKLLR